MLQDQIILPPKFVFRSGQKLYSEVISRNDRETPTLDPERDFIDPEKKYVSFG